MLRFLVALPVLVFAGTLAYGLVTGRVRARQSCCAPPADRDLRLR